MTTSPTAVPAARAHADLAAILVELGHLTASVQLMAADTATATHTRIALEQAGDSLLEAMARTRWALVKLDLVAREGLG